MKLGYLTASISRQAGGLKDSVRREGSALRNCGAEVEVFAAEDSDSALDLVEWKALKVNLVRSVGPARFSYAPGFSRALEDADLDVLASHGLWRYTSIAASKWHARTHRPYVVSPHGMLDPWALRNSRLRKRLAGFFFENKHLEGASCIRALCRAEATAIRNYGLRNPIAIIPNGVDLPVIGTPSIPPWNCVPGFANAEVAFSLGRLHRKKNLRALLEAWKRLRQGSIAAADEWRLVIAGWDEGSYGEELRRCVGELNLMQDVWLAGPLFGEAKAAAYRSASAFVIPSLSEGLPMVVLEAWSYGLPVIMTSQCNLPEGFRANAAICTGTDSGSIADALMKMIGSSNSELTEMGDRGRSLCAERFNWDRIGEQTEKLLLWVTGDGGRPAFVEL